MLPDYIANEFLNEYIYVLEFLMESIIVASYSELYLGYEYGREPAEIIMREGDRNNIKTLQAVSGLEKQVVFANQKISHSRRYVCIVE